MPFKHFLAAAKLAAVAADDKMAFDILVMDVKKTSGVADYFVLVSVDSSTQLSAVAAHVARRLREELHLHATHNDGRKSIHWAALDYGSLVVHVMHKQARELYALERLWDGARRVRWEVAVPVSKPARRRSAE